MEEKIVKTGITVIALLVALSGALWGVDHTYMRNERFAQHEVKHIKQELFENQKLIWAYEDRAKKTTQQSEVEALKQRIRELEYQNKILMEQLKKQGG